MTLSCVIAMSKCPEERVDLQAHLLTQGRMPHFLHGLPTSGFVRKRLGPGDWLPDEPYDGTALSKS